MIKTKWHLLYFIVLTSATSANAELECRRFPAETLNDQKQIDGFSGNHFNNNKSSFVYKDREYFPYSLKAEHWLHDLAKSPHDQIANWVVYAMSWDYCQKTIKENIKGELLCSNYMLDKPYDLYHIASATHLKGDVSKVECERLQVRALGKTGLCIPLFDNVFRFFDFAAASFDETEFKNSDDCETKNGLGI